jgi:hypothetical protein
VSGQLYGSPRSAELRIHLSIFISIADPASVLLALIRGTQEIDFHATRNLEVYDEFIASYI